MKKLSKCVIFGGTGFIGSNLASKLASHVSEIVVLTRNPDAHKSLKIIPNLSLVKSNLNDERNIRDNLSNADLVINTVGILNEFDQINTYENLHYQLVKKISNAVKFNGVRRLLHISSLNAKQNETSKYLHTKGLAEDFIMSETSKFCKVTVFRPSIVFGEKDSFFNKFATILKFSPILPLACPYAKFQPIYVGDLTDYMIKTINDEQTYAQKIDATGPKVYSFIDLIRLTLSVMDMYRVIIPLNHMFSKLQARVFQNLPGKIFTMDNYNSLQLDSTSNSGFIGSTTVEDLLPKYLILNDKSRHLRQKAGRKK